VERGRSVALAQEVERDRSSPATLAVSAEKEAVIGLLVLILGQLVIVGVEMSGLRRELTSGNSAMGSGRSMKENLAVNSIKSLFLGT
jgi:hypothetical protein